MSNWSGGIMTAAGRALQAKVEAGTKLELTHVKLGDGTETGDAVDELTDLVGGKAVLGISSTTVKDSLCTVTSVILTENVSTGFWAREWGLFAKDPDEGEILYMISLDPNPEFVPPSTAAVKQSATYAMSIAVSNAANIAVKIDPEGLTTNEMLAAAACLVERDKAYTVGERLYTPTLRRGLLLQCTKAGTTADTMLDCSTAELSDTITDGGVTWAVVEYALTTDVPPLASALATPRKIELSGDATGSATFDGSGDVTITATVSHAASADAVAYIPDCAASHNGIYRGKDLTSYFESGDMSDAIAAGTFDDIYPGDYIIKSVTIDGTTYKNVKWIVMDLDYHLHSGDTETTAHHVVLMPETILGAHVMNATNNTTGGYVGSVMWTTHIPKVVTGIEAAFGDTHVLSHRELLSNTVDTTIKSCGYNGATGAASHWAWTDVKVNLANEPMVYGIRDVSSSLYDVGECASQLAAFRLNTGLKCSSRQWWWLRAVSASMYFVNADNRGNPTDNGAGNTGGGVRPYFLLR